MWLCGPLQDSVTWYNKISSDDKTIDIIRKNILKLVFLPSLNVSWRNGKKFCCCWKREILLTNVWLTGKPTWCYCTTWPSPAKGLLATLWTNQKTHFTCHPIPALAYGTLRCCEFSTHTKSSLWYFDIFFFDNKGWLLYKLEIIYLYTAYCLQRVWPIQLHIFQNTGAEPGF
jgi:hypothetical protein